MLASGESVSVRVQKRGHLRGSSEKGKNLLRKKIICLFLSFLHSQLKHKKSLAKALAVSSIKTCATFAALEFDFLYFFTFVYLLQC